MDSFGVREPHFERPLGRKLRLVNRLLRALKWGGEVVPTPDPTQQMSTLEQRINLWHLAEQPIGYGVAGEYVDVGCYDGQQSTLIARAIDGRRPLHVFDSFETSFGLYRDVLEVLRENFGLFGLPVPVVHKGRFEQTIPDELPPVIAFAQIDCGVGGDSDLHRAILFHCLSSVWERLSKGGIIVIQDYHDGGSKSVNHYPYIKPLVDEFLAPRGARATALESGAFSHAFVRK
jgi:O-methyltransferase